VARILRDYVTNLCAEFVAVHGEKTVAGCAERLRQSMANIHKRLGGERFQRLSALLGQASTSSCAAVMWSLHRAGSKGCSRNTTTRCTPTSANAKAGRIEFAGDAREVREYL
jgi:tRNA 2-selenouridine synthase